MDDYVNTDPAPSLDELTIGSLLSRLQRAHIEKLLKAAEDPENMNAQIMAQINRFLADNGLLLNMPGQAMIDVTPREEQDKLPALKPQVELPVYDQRYDD